MISQIVKGLILVVDDDYAIRKFLVMALETEGYKVDAASNGLEALTLIRQKGSKKYDLILLDMQMPVMDGWKFLPIYHLEEHLGLKAPVIVMSAPMTLTRYASQIKADGYLPKPFHLEDLLTLIKRHFPDSQ